ncbi:hypothetical protein TNCV_821921 [Trichonephila clavipes]|nr:hypothetical protein TNCV_821921 [Trichonephila clavipes]
MDYTACKKSLECLLGLGVLGENKSLYMLASAELRCLSVGRKLGFNLNCGASSHWCGVAVRRGGVSSGVDHIT